MLLTNFPKFLVENWENIRILDLEEKPDQEVAHLDREHIDIEESKRLVEILAVDKIVGSNERLVSWFCFYFSFFGFLLAFG